MKIWSLDDIVNRRHIGGERYYDRDEVDAVLKRQASAAIAGMNAATAISSGQLQQAHTARWKSSSSMASYIPASLTSLRSHTIWPNSHRSVDECSNLSDDDSVPAVDQFIGRKSHLLALR